MSRTSQPASHSYERLRKKFWPMRVLSFPNFSKNRSPAVAKDWSQQEIADFYRAHRLLVENGAGIGIDRGVSDIGEPWMVFFDLATQDVFMHVARINGRCILICEQLGIHLKAADITILISDFENAVRDHLAVRTERNSKIVIHPAARIIMSISMVFLLFKLDNSNAHAKALADNSRTHQGAEVATARSDYSPMQRAHGAFSRLLESVDSPASAAVLAGIILAGELAMSSKASVAETHHTETAALHEPVVPVDTPDATSRSLVGNENQGRPAEHPSQLHSLPVVAIPDKDDVVVQRAEKDKATVEDNIEKNNTPSKQDVETSTPVVIKNEAETAAVSTQDLQSKESETVIEQAPQSVKTLEVLFGWSLETKDIEKISSIIKPIAELPVTANHISDISVASLDTIDDHVGFFVQTALPDEQLREILVHFISSFGERFEIEYLGGRVLIEQSDMAGLSDHDIGLWTNMMADGSSISVVGQANLIDDVAGLVS